MRRRTPSRRKSVVYSRVCTLPSVSLFRSKFITVLPCYRPSPFRKSSKRYSTSSGAARLPIARRASVNVEARYSSLRDYRADRADAGSTSTNFPPAGPVPPPSPSPPPRAIPRFRQSASGRSTFDVEHKRVDARSFIDQTPKPRGREGRKEGRKEDRRGGKAFRCHVRAITLRGLLRSGGSSGAVNNGYGSGRNRSSGRNENSYYGSISGSTFLRVH